MSRPTPTMSSREAVDLQHANEFITSMLTTEQKSALSVALTQAAGVLSQTGASLDDCLFDLTISAENCLYEQHLQSGRQIDVMQTTPILTRTSADPHAIKPCDPGGGRREDVPNSQLSHFSDILTRPPATSVQKSCVRTLLFLSELDLKVLSVVSEKCES